jgi:fumarate hydratase, class II
VRVLGNHSTISMAGSQGQFQLNVYKPVIIHTLMQSMRLLTDAMFSFNEHCVKGLQPQREQLALYMSRSLMLVTALAPALGYEQAAKVAGYADDNQCSLREAVVALDLMSEAEFDRSVDPRKMLGPQR